MSLSPSRTIRLYYRNKPQIILRILFSFAFSFLSLSASLHAAAADEISSDPFPSRDLIWSVRLGTNQYTIPRIDSHQIFIGINDRGLEHPAIKRTGGGILMCLDRQSARMLWQLPIPRYMEGTKPPFHFNHWKCGVCSRPALDGKKLFLVGPRGDVLCLDRNGQADGNDPPFLKETEYMHFPPDPNYQLTPYDGDIIWRFDLIKKLSIVPHDVCGSTPLLLGDHLYVCTSNGMDDTHQNVANPSAPTLIVLDKNSGRLLAADAELIGKRMLHGHWSSPIAAKVNNKTIILFGGGDGVLYAFEPFVSSAADHKPETLKKIWQYDCNPSDYRKKDGKKIPYSSWNKKSPEGPSEIIATPVVHENRIYIAIGQSPIHGPGKGLLSCIDAATGKKIWDSRLVDRSLSNAAIHKGLLYISDFSGKLNCFDAKSGTHLWQHNLGAGVWSASPIVVNEKVYISTEANILWVLKAAPQRQVLSRSRLKSMAITPTIHDGVFYLPTQKRLFAVNINPDSM